MARLLDNLERRLRPYAPPNLTLALIFSQVASFGLSMANPNFLERISLRPRLVLDGELWRLFTFLAQPPCQNIIFAFFGWYMLYLMGTALELNWGSFRYDLFLLIGYVGTVATSFLAPDTIATNVFFEGTIFLAFAYLFPDFQLYLFFLIPVKIKYFAMFTWALYFLSFAFGDWADRAIVAAGVANFFLFFGRDVAYRMSAGKRRMQHQRRKIVEPDKPRHICAVCGLTERTAPQSEFRYCSKCRGSYEYCAEHLRQHEHREE